MLLFASFASLAYANFFFDSIGVNRSPRALSLFTCCLSCMSNNFLMNIFMFISGEYRSRTDDLLNANQAL